MPVIQQEKRQRWPRSAAKLPAHGASLTSRGLGVGLEGDLGSAVIELREAG